MSNRAVEGSAIYCLDGSRPFVYGNLITGNESDEGTSNFCQESDAIISNNIIYSNAGTYSGGIGCVASSPTISQNIISGNSVLTAYGGISAYSGSNLIIRSNHIIANTTENGAGGIYISVPSSAVVFGNYIRANTSQYHTGGIESSGAIIRNTVYENVVYGVPVAGGIKCTGNGFVAHCIIWNNTNPQIWGGNTNYSDIQGGYPGFGNLNQYPAFVDSAHDDYRLLWGSPCIDSGHPDSLDPDGTRADIGAFYFDQSVSVRVLLTPHQIPYVIPATGGSLNFTIRLDNWTSAPHIATVWCDVTLPDSSIFGPVLGPATVSIPANTMLARVRTQSFPAAAPLSVYHYNAYAVVEGDTGKDSFMFGKLGNQLLRAGSWTNIGESLKAFELGESMAAPVQPAAFALYPSTPNPFNPITLIRFHLSEAGQICLRVNDITGGLVSTLINGWRGVGSHEVTFDGSNLASGIYFYTLKAGPKTASGKMVLMR
jgi:hypothetical protein